MLSIERLGFEETRGTLFNEMAEQGFIEEKGDYIDEIACRKLHGLFEGMVCDNPPFMK